MKTLINIRTQQLLRSCGNLVKFITKEEAETYRAILKKLKPNATFTVIDVPEYD